MKLLHASLLAWLLPFVRPKCIPNPSHDCSNVRDEEKCQQSYTCELNCAANLDICWGFEENHCRKVYGTNPPACDDLSTHQEDCEQYPDCLWDSSPDRLWGPFTCGVSFVWDFASSTVGRTFTNQPLGDNRPCLTFEHNPDDKVCGLTNETLGDWFALVHGGWPIRVTNEETIVDNLLFVFNASSDDALDLNCVSIGIRTSIVLNGDAEDVFYIFVARDQGEAIKPNQEVRFRVGAEMIVDSGEECDYYCWNRQRSVSSAGFQASCSCDPTEVDDVAFLASVIWDCEVCNLNQTLCAIPVTDEAFFNRDGKLIEYHQCAEVTTGSKRDLVCMRNNKSMSFSINDQSCLTEDGCYHDCTNVESGLVIDHCEDGGTGVNAVAEFYAQYFVTRRLDEFTQGRCGLNENGKTSAGDPLSVPSVPLGDIAATFGVSNSILSTVLPYIGVALASF